MATTAKYRTTQLEGQSVSYIEADLEAVTVQNVGSNSVKTSGKFGTNGTFLDRKSGEVYGIACASKGVAVRPNGTLHAKGYKRGTMVCFNTPGGTRSISVPIINAIKDAGYPLDWINWAIGGMSLHCDRSTFDNNETAFTKEVVSVENANGINGVSPAYKANRTAIGYKQSTRKIILVAAANATPFQMRSILKQLGADYGVMLDGSDLSQMRGKKTDGTTADANTNSTLVWHMVTVDPSNWA